MSRVGFVIDAKTAYVSSPLKDVVDLAKTQMDPILQGKPSAAQPVPSPTIAGSSDIGANQCFDVIALLQLVGESHQHVDNRSSFIVKTT